MEQSALDALKTKREDTLNAVISQSNGLRIAKEHVTHLDAQLRKVQKRYELLDRKIFEMENEKRIKAEMITATKKAKASKAPKSPKAKLKSKLDTILSSM